MTPFLFKKSFLTPLFILFFLLLPLGITSVAGQENGGVVISEIMASNNKTIADEDGDYPDWIELHNQGDIPVDLEGWGLSDDATNPFRWVFPKVTIMPDEYLLVWASNKDRRPSLADPSMGIVREVYMGIPGTSVDDLIAHSSYPDNPTLREIVTDYFEAPIDIADEYGQRMHGMLKAPQSGEYTFWISGDDNSRLFLSMNDNPADKTLIAEVPGWTSSREWDKFPEQKSDPVILEEGNYYYISALMKEGHGGDNLAVQWQLPDGTMETPLDASHIFQMDAELHSNFAISSDGEPILLTKPGGETVQFVDAVIIPSDISYGRQNGTDTYVYFDNPTPGAPNDSQEGYSEIINETPVFSHDGGFYTSSFDLSISSTLENADIYYTLDGSEPDPINTEAGASYYYSEGYPSGTMSSRQSGTFKYSGPISIKDRSDEPYELASINTRFTSSPLLPRSNIFKGTVVRAKVIKENAMTTESSTHTFFVTPEGEGRYELPVVSIVTDEENLFDYENGIYVPGKIADDWYTANDGNGWNDGRPANYNQRGREWERPAHFEYFDNQARAAIRQDVGIRIHGGWTRAYPMKSIRLYARASYDSDDTFYYPFFGELPARGNPDDIVASFRRLILRNSGNDNPQTMYRDALIQSLVSHLPFAVQAYQPTVHFINGEYWGVINLRERYDKYYIESHYGVDEDDVAILEVYGSVDTGDPENRELFLDVVDYAESYNLRNETRFKWIKERVDVDNLAHYYAVQIYLHNTDWPQNNMTFWRKQTNEFLENAPRGHDGRWRWMLYDTDFGMNLYGSNDQVLNSLGRVMNDASDPSSILFRQLMDNDGFRSKFINILTDHLNSCFKSSRISAKVAEYNNLLSGSKNEHYNRWSSGTHSGNKIVDFGEDRTSNLLSHASSEFNLTGNVTLTISKRGNGGVVKVNSITLDENTVGVPDGSPYPWSGTYFKDVPVILKALETSGFRFSHWESNSVEIDDPHSAELEVILDGNTEIEAVFEQEERELMHYWDFNYLPDGNLGPLSANFSETDEPAILSYPGTGEGYMDRVSDGTDMNARNDAPAARALRVRNPSDTRELIITLPSAGYEETVMKYAVKRTSNGAQIQDVYFRTEEDGEWQIIKSGLLITEDYQLVTIDFSEIPNVDNNPHFAVRILFSGDTVAGTSGNNRFDNISFEGYPTSASNLESVFNDGRVTVFPVPASERVNIESLYRINLVYLYNLKGEVLRTINPGTFKHEENISGLAPGFYFLDIRTDAGHTIKKIIVE